MKYLLRTQRYICPELTRIQTRYQHLSSNDNIPKKDIPDNSSWLLKKTENEEDLSKKVFPDDNWVLKNVTLDAKSWFDTKISNFSAKCESILKNPPKLPQPIDKTFNSDIIKYNLAQYFLMTRNKIQELKKTNGYIQTENSIKTGATKLGQNFTEFIEKHLAEIEKKK